MCLAEQDEMNQQLQRELAAARGVSGSPDEQATPQQATPQQATPSNWDATPLTASFLQVDTASIVPEDLFMKTATDSAVPSSLWSS
jgi:hypothetical protein